MLPLYFSCAFNALIYRWPSSQSRCCSYSRFFFSLHKSNTTTTNSSLESFCFLLFNFIGHIIDFTPKIMIFKVVILLWWSYLDCKLYDIFILIEKNRLFNVNVIKRDKINKWKRRLQISFFVLSFFQFLKCSSGTQKKSLWLTFYTRIRNVISKLSLNGNADVPNFCFFFIFFIFSSLLLFFHHDKYFATIMNEQKIEIKWIEMFIQLHNEV